VLWLSSLYEAFGRLYYSRGFVEEVAAGAATTMVAEFAGDNQYGVYTIGQTLEQASNGSPARAIGDGENGAWSIYTPNADFGNAEISEFFYPILYLGRNLEPDSGGYGRFRGGLGHTAVWMVKNSPGIEYICGCAGLRSKIIPNHGMFGAYPTPPDRPSYARGTNVKELIDAQKPLVHERGDPEDPNLARNIEAEDLQTNIIAPIATGDIFKEHDLIIHPVSGSQAMGDPIERDPEDVRDDLERSWTRERVAREIYGVVAERTDDGHWTVDGEATEAARSTIREQRKARGIPFKEWWRAERKRVMAGEGMSSAVTKMWRTSMELTPEYGRELRAFWKLPEDFTFDASEEGE
jgi:N-methylhydantoinase B/oxoprolinase/acetone carboxylase alpha subunit